MFLLGWTFSRYGHGNKLNIRQDKFPQLDRDPLDFKNFEQMFRERLGQSLDQPIAPVAHELFRFRANGRVVDRLRDLVIELRCIAPRPERDAECEALRRGALVIRHTDVRENFKLLDLNLVIHAIGMWQKAAKRRVESRKRSLGPTPKPEGASLLLPQKILGNFAFLFP